MRVQTRWQTYPQMFAALSGSSAECKVCELVRHHGSRSLACFHHAPRSRGLGAVSPAKIFKETINTSQGYAVIAGLQAAYVLAETTIKRLTPTTLTEAWLMYTLVGQLVRMASPQRADQLLSDHKKAALANIWKDHDRITDLRTRLWEAAQKGQLPDGTAYNWTKWKTQAQTIAEDIAAQVQYQVETNVFTNLLRLIADMVISVVEAFDEATDPDKPLVLPWYVWAIGGVVALGAAAYVVNTARSLVPMPPRRRLTT